MSKNIVLIGFMGSGKSTVGRRLARATGYGFVDTDQAVEAKTGKKVAEIFEEEGEPVFRALERGAIEKASASENRVIACGGGAVMDSENVDFLKRTGVLVYLKASEQSLLKRLERGLEKRPLLKAESADERVKELLSQRVHTYESVADEVIETDGLTPMKVVEKIIERLEIQA